MKQSVIHSSFIILTSLLVGCATQKDAYDIKPEETKDATPSAVEWQNANDAALAAAMRPEALSTYVKSAAAADALLAEVKGAYKTDPMVAMRVGAITQLVMSPKCAKAKDCRKVWSEALLRAAEGSADAYRTMFFLDQLRWCGTEAQVPRIQALGGRASEKCVRDFAAWTVREIEK